ncbi:MAG TPA: acetyl-CoA C-acetyltransferase [Acidimicrobiales bacterium]
MPDAVIVSTVRTPIGRAAKGSLTQVRPDDMAATVIRAALDRVPALDPATVEDVVLGCAQPAGSQGWNLARFVSDLAGMGHVPGVTVNRYCSSSLQAIRMCAHAIRAGEGDVFVAAGVETVSQYGLGMADGGGETLNPRMRPARERSRERSAGGAPEWTPFDGDIADYDIAMGQTAENVAQLEGVSRQEQDEFAARSQQRATAARDRGFFEREIVPLDTVDADGNPVTVHHDDGIRPGTTAERLAELKPVFRPDGTVTAGNACPLNDGAAAVIVMSDRRASELGLTPLARIISSGVSALDPEIMGLGPVEACRQAMARAGMTIDDIDLVEINEAFAAQVVPSARHLGISWDQLNVNGGAIAVGHPFGMTGARIMTTLLNALDDTDRTIGMESMCVGGGQGMAMIVERLS